MFSDNTDMCMGKVHYIEKLASHTEREKIRSQTQGKQILKYVRWNFIS